MKKNIKKLTLYAATTLLVISAGIKIKNCKDESEEFTNKVIEYTTDFDDDDFLIAAHRGYSSLEVENTKEALDLANDSDYVDYIEIDVRLTKDKKLVLAHNNSLLTRQQQTIEICNEKYKDIIDNDYYYLSNSLGIKLENLFNTDNGDILRERSKLLESKNYNITSLKDGLNSCKDKKILLDLKFRNNTKDFIKALEKELNGIDTSNIIFQSDDLLPLLCLQKKHPEYSYLAIMKTESDLEYIELFDNIGLKETLVTKKIVNNLIKDDKTVAIWTLNNPSDIDRITNKLGDNYKEVIYISDYPDVVATCLNEKEKRSEKHFTKN